MIGFHVEPFALAKYIPTHQSTLETYLEWRFAQQRLARPSEPDAVRLLVSCGWLEPKAHGAELALYNRIQGNAPAALRQSVKDGLLVNVRGPRGRRYWVERSVAPFAIAAANRPLARRWKPVWTGLGLDDDKKQAFRLRVLELLGDSNSLPDALAARAPEALRAPLPPEAAKKVGLLGRVLDLLLVEMEEAGLVHLSDEGWARFETRFPKLPKPGEIPFYEAQSKVIERYFAWGNAATPADVAWWGGWSATQVEKILLSGDLPLANLVMAGGMAHGFMIHQQYAESLRIHKPLREAVPVFLPERDPLFSHNPHLYRRVLDEKQLGILFHREDKWRPAVFVQGKPVAAWRMEEAGPAWTGAARIDPVLRKRMQSAADRLMAWLRDQKLELPKGYG